MCKVLKVSRSSYYKYLNSKKRYGAPKINASLKSLGINISLKRTQRIMNKLGIKSIVTKKFRPFSNKVNIVEKDALMIMLE